LHNAAGAEFVVHQTNFDRTTGQFKTVQLFKRSATVFDQPERNIAITTRYILAVLFNADVVNLQTGQN
jgi:hypothetical protein